MVCRVTCSRSERLVSVSAVAAAAVLSRRTALNLASTSPSKTYYYSHSTSFLSPSSTLRPVHEPISSRDRVGLQYSTFLDLGYGISTSCRATPTLSSTHKTTVVAKTSPHTPTSCSPIGKTVHTLSPSSPGRFNSLRHPNRRFATTCHSQSNTFVHLKTQADISEGNTVSQLRIAGVAVALVGAIWLVGPPNSNHVEAAGREGFVDEPSNNRIVQSTKKEDEMSGTATPTGGEPLNAATAPVEKTPEDSSKLKTLLALLKKFIGVSDLAAVRFSLPAHLLEPTPNLEYWTYLDRPETFVSIPDSDDPTSRMLATLRFWFTKDLKYVKGKPVKPYNSTLGEFFRCNWIVDDTLPQLKPMSAPASSAASISSSHTQSASTPGSKVKVSFLTEQTSHHPPVSAFVIDCPEKGITARGYDQISAKFTGTSIRVTAGQHNLGIFIELQNRDGEQYQLTHPAAYLGGLLRGNLSVSVADTCYITCPKTRLKVILQYHEEGWIGKAQNRVEGAMFKYNPDKDETTKLRDIPEKDVIARIEGSWMDKVYYTMGSGAFTKSSNKNLLIDVNPLTQHPKSCPPMDQQLPNESRKFWSGVTDAIVNKQYSLATQLKTEIEDRQRKKAAERKEANKEWKPRFFKGAVTPAGKPELTADGEAAMKGLREEKFELEPNKELGA